LNTALTAPIVRSLSPVVQITSAEKNVPTVRPTPNVERASSAVITNVSVVGLLVSVRSTPNATVASNAVIANASVVRILVSVPPTTNVTVASSAVTAFASIAGLHVSVRTTSNVTVERNAVMENASAVRLLVHVLSTSNVTLERNAMGECVLRIYLFVIRREVRMQPIKPQKKQLEKPITNQSQIHESPELPKRLLQTPTTIGSTEPLPKPQKIITTSQSRKHASPEPPKRPLQKPTTNQLQTLGSKESPKRPVQKPTTSQGQTRGSTEPAIKPRKTITAGQSQSHESKTSGWPITRDEFLMWFWDSTNGNQLILDLNKFANSKRWDDRIRQEKYRPFIYAIVLNDGSFPFQAKDENVEDGTEKQWKLCKVGFTKKSVERGINNRMEQLSDKIKKTYQPKNYKEAMPYTLFAVPFRAIDTNPYHDTKKRIREKIGKRVKKEKPRN
ncbi:hypothetical protein AWC38_SpisGene23374, partial [Stylophora pistillata]